MEPTAGQVLDDALTESQRDMQSYGLDDTPPNRRRMRVSSIARLKTLTLAPWQWAALCAVAQSMAKEGE